MGLNFRPKFNNKYTLAGTFYEHKILDTIPFVEKDNQIMVPLLRLRVNYDGMVGKAIKEVKTYKEDKPFKVSKAYWRQAQVEMFAAGSTDLVILAYPMTEEHYKNYFLEVDPEKIEEHRVEYDEDFVEGEYLPKLIYLKECIDVGAFPKKEGFEAWHIEKAEELRRLTSQLLLNIKSFSVMAEHASPAVIPSM